MAKGKFDLAGFIKFILKLKTVKRKGWINNAKILNAESVADHTFSTCVLGMLFSDMLQLDTEKVMKMIIIHDLAESIIGDYIPGEISTSDKLKKENDAIHHILSYLPIDISSIYYNIWEEYQSGSTKESQLVKILDKLELLLQADIYLQKGYSKKNLKPFFDSSSNYIYNNIQNKNQKSDMYYYMSDILRHLRSIF